MKKLCYFLLALCMLFVLPLVQSAHAEASDTFEVTYDFDYYVKTDNSVDIGLKVSIKNLRPDIYVNEFAVSFPKSFDIENLRATDGVNPIPFKQENYTAMTKVSFTFTEPAVPQAENTIVLNYSINNLYNHTGSVAEMILPLIVKKDHTTVNATLHLPENFDKTLSVAKPIPTHIEFNNIHWDNVTQEALYVLFGDKQQYRTSLKYYLDNPGFATVKKYIALPPETLYQKVYIESLEPKPEYTTIDEDGNFLAFYSIGPHQHKNIEFKGIVQALIQPQEELKPYIQDQFTHQKKYLLSERKFWGLGGNENSDVIKNIKNVEDVYLYVTELLSYASQIDKTTVRRGAPKAIEEPFKAVCTEYTDLFMAVAREKGVYSREIQGYAYTEDRKIRPLLSASTDVLHSWVEYYDEARQLWVPVDPTWGDTSKVDYLHAFDVNHIALAIHGKDSEYPYPAGFYKKGDSKDISVSIASGGPTIKNEIYVDVTAQKNLYRGQSSDMVVRVTNNGNAFVNDLNIPLEAKNITFSKTALEIGQIAPYQTKEVRLSIKPQDVAEDHDVITFSYNGEILRQEYVEIHTQAQNILQNTLGVIIGAIFLLGGLKFALRKRHGHKR